MIGAHKVEEVVQQSTPRERKDGCVKFTEDGRQRKLLYSHDQPYNVGWHSGRIPPSRRMSLNGATVWLPDGNRITFNVWRNGKTWNATLVGKDGNPRYGSPNNMTGRTQAHVRESIVDWAEMMAPALILRLGLVD